MHVGEAGLKSHNRLTEHTTFKLLLFQSQISCNSSISCRHLHLFFPI